MSKQSKKPKIVCVSGHWDVLHAGHLAYIKAAKDLGDVLIAICNSDRQIWLKRGEPPFMPEEGRLRLVEALKWVDYAVLAIDEDASVCRTLEMLRPDVFANGGDVTLENCREAEVCLKMGTRLAFGVGGTDKLCSSSELIRLCRENAVPSDPHWV